VSERGKAVRADYRLVSADAPERIEWRQEVEGTVFARILREASTVIELASAGEGTSVTIRIRQKLRGLSRLGGALFRRATGRQLDEALDALAALLEASA
jgi:hypothetical protein